MELEDGSFGLPSCKYAAPAGAWPRGSRSLEDRRKERSSAARRQFARGPRRFFTEEVNRGIRGIRGQRTGPLRNSAYSAYSAVTASSVAALPLCASCAFSRLIFPLRLRPSKRATGRPSQSGVAPRLPPDSKVARPRRLHRPCHWPGLLTSDFGLRDWHSDLRMAQSFGEGLSACAYSPQFPMSAPCPSPPSTPSAPRDQRSKLAG